MLRFVTTSRSENGYGFWRPGLKTGVENDIFWSEIGSGFGEPAGALHQELIEVPPGNQTSNLSGPKLS